MRDFWNEVKTITIFAIIAMIVGYLLIVCVNFIPKEMIAKNVKASGEIMAKQEDTPEMFLKGVILENFSDADAISLTYNKDNNPFYDALYAYNYQLSKTYAHRGPTALKLTAEDKTQELHKYEHSQEWHGFQTWLRPLLTHYDVSDIRYACFLVVQILLILVCMNISQICNNKWAFIPFLIGFEYFCYTFESISILFSTDFCAMLLGCLAIIKAVEQNKDFKYIGKIFAIIAIADSYFSMFNMQLITIGFPLLVWLGITDWKNPKNLDQKNNWTILYSLYWLFAYSLMTFSKIFITKVFLGMKGGVYAIKYYTGTIAKSTLLERAETALDLFKETLTANPMARDILILLLISLIIYSLIKKRFAEVSIKRCLPFLYVAAFPAIFQSVMIMYSGIWWIVTYWSIAIFAITQLFWNVAFGNQNTSQKSDI